MALIALAACDPAPELASLPETDVALPPVRATMEGVANRSGSALARLPDESALILADEDHGVLRRIALPVDANDTADVVSMPGAPAQVIALADRVLVTIREPGMLIELDHALHERARVDLPSDAWGMAVSADGRTAVVTSAWTHRATGIDLSTMTPRWSLLMAREPRGIAIAEDGTAYVSHLVGSRITKISGIHGESPTSERTEVMPSPLRSPAGRLLHASLGYSAVLSPDGKRLFLPRHALGAQGREWWFGQPTVDVMLTADETSLAPRNVNVGGFTDFATGDLMDVQGSPPIEVADFVQPRDAIYRKSKNTLLVASEGDNLLAELDARALDPSLATRRVYRLATYEGDEYPYANIVVSGGAPSAIALSADEKMAWVFCRSTYDIAIVELDQEEDDLFPYVHLADDPLGEDGAKGRRLFYDATDGTISGGLGCAGCHPEGRDDGHVWHENFVDESFGGYRGTDIVADGPEGSTFVSRGVPRQTPMLAGRVRASGPYGWRGESPTLEARIRAGFSLHRWQGTRESSWMVTMDRPKLLASFLRQGLVAPKASERALTAQEQRGKELFAHADVGCASCHVPATEFTDRIPL
ncbi:MAG TPA: hypothetical protein VFB62_19895, partial [Polyangiaceae bacterium]|nr:hypothetical protein [Polyangiaceae bacterium]